MRKSCFFLLSAAMIVVSLGGCNGGAGEDIAQGKAEVLSFESAKSVEPQLVSTDELVKLVVEDTTHWKVVYFFDAVCKPCREHLQKELREMYARHDTALWRFYLVAGFNWLHVLTPDEEGNLVEGPFGWARFRNEIDEYGNIVRESYFDQNDNPEYFQGYHTVVYEYDDRGFLHTSYFLDVDGNPCVSQDYGFHMQKMSYNSQGYVVDDCFYDENGKQCNSYEGFSRGTLAYDAYGNITERCYYDADNKLLDPSQGYSKVKSKFDEMGNEIETFYYDANDSLCQVDDDLYAGVRHTYDKNHHQLETRYYGTDGKLIETKEGYAIARNTYNALGNCTETRTFDSQERPCNRGKGYARKTAKYDYHGRITEESYFDVNGKPCNDTTGVSTRKYTYDHFGNVTVSLSKMK